MAFDALYCGHIPGWITWRLPVTGTNEAAIPPLPGWSVVTPVGWARMGQSESVTVLNRSGDEVLVSQNALILRYRGA